MGDPFFKCLASRKQIINVLSVLEEIVVYTLYAAHAA